jgi:GT2 family glycosyltransferase
MEADPRIAVVQTRVVDPDSGKPEGMGRHPDRVNINHYRATFLGGAALIRTEAFRRAGGFPHYLLGGGEMFLSLRLLDMGYRIYHYGGTTIFHKRSVHERIPHLRFYLGNKQQLRAIMSHYPGVARPLSELVWKLGSYTLGALRRRYAWRLPWDLPRLLGWGLTEWRGPWIIRNDTVALFDYLTANLVTSADDYDAIVVDRGYLRSRIMTRLGIRSMPKVAQSTRGS